MAKGVSKEVLTTFIISELRKGSERGEILAKVSEKWQTPSRTFDTYHKIAKEQFLLERERIEKEKADITTQNELEGLKRELMDVNERKDILTKIARGEIPLNKPMVCDGVIQLVPVVPDWTDRRGAIAELNKMDGSYAPIKQANTNVAGEDKDIILTLKEIKL